MSQLLTQIEGILKDKYQPAIANQINIEPSPFLEKIKKVPLTNNTIKSSKKQAIHIYSIKNKVNALFFVHDILRCAHKMAGIHKDSFIFIISKLEHQIRFRRL